MACALRLRCNRQAVERCSLQRDVLLYEMVKLLVGLRLSCEQCFVSRFQFRLRSLILRKSDPIEETQAST